MIFRRRQSRRSTPTTMAVKTAPTRRLATNCVNPDRKASARTDRSVVATKPMCCATWTHAQRSVTNAMTMTTIVTMTTPMGKKLTAMVAPPITLSNALLSSPSSSKSVFAADISTRIALAIRDNVRSELLASSSRTQKFDAQINCCVGFKRIDAQFLHHRSAIFQESNEQCHAPKRFQMTGDE
jgi:hypothetical protein